MIGLEYILTFEKQSLKEIAEKLGISPQTVGDWIKGRRNIPKERLKQLSEIFKLAENVFQAIVTPSDELKIQIALIENESHSNTIPGCGVERKNEEIIKLLKRNLEIEEKRGDIINRYKKIIEHLTEEGDEEQVMKDRLYRALVQSTNDLLSIFETEKNQLSSLNMTDIPKVKMAKDMLFFVNKLFGVDENKWEDISQHLIDTPTERFDKQLALLQKEYYPIKPGKNKHAQRIVLS